MYAGVVPARFATSSSVNPFALMLKTVSRMTAVEVVRSTQAA